MPVAIDAGAAAYTAQAPSSAASYCDRSSAQAAFGAPAANRIRAKAPCSSERCAARRVASLRASPHKPETRCSIETRCSVNASERSRSFANS